MSKEYLKEWGFKKEDFEDLFPFPNQIALRDEIADKANMILFEKIRAHSVPVRLYKGPKYTHEGRVILIKEIEEK